MSSTTSSFPSSDTCVMLLSRVFQVDGNELAQGRFTVGHPCGRDWEWIVVPVTWGMKMLTFCMDDVDSEAGRSDEY